jgi:hypothetical protein
MAAVLGMRKTVFCVITLQSTIYHNHIFPHTNLKYFLKYFLNGNKLWKELIRLLSVDGQPIKADLAQTCVGVFFIRAVSDTIFAMPFLPKPQRTTW